MPTLRPRDRGFTLIELMVTVVILTILATIAYPSYTEYVSRVRRANARSAMEQAAQFMHRFYVTNDRYDQDLGGAQVAIPSGLAKSPKDGDAVEYVIEISAVTRGTFALRAVPAAPDKCGTFHLDHTGKKWLAGAAVADEATCWR